MTSDKSNHPEFPEGSHRTKEASPAPKASCGWCKGNPIGHCHICQAKPSTPETYADDPPQRPNDAQPEVDALRVLADRVNRWFMFDNAPNLLAMREALDNVQRAQPRTDSACSDLDLDVVNEVKDRIQAELDDDRADDRTRSVLCAARGVLRAVLVSQQRTEPAVAYVAGDKLELARDGLWPGFKAGTKGTVTRLEDGIVHFHIDGHGGDYATSVNNVRPAGARRERALPWVERAAEAADHRAEKADHRELTDTDVEGIYNDGWRDAIESVRKLLDLAGSPPSSSDPKEKP